MVEVVICIGTYSYVMGGADLINMEGSWKEEWKGKVRISGAISIDGCDEKTMKPPYASVNGRIVEAASVEKIRRMIIEELEK